jgi:heptosyltransferase-2
MARLLIVKFGAIGDCVMLLPAAMERVRAGWQVEWVCGRAVEPVLRLFPELTLIVVDEAPLLRGSTTERLRAMAALWKRLGRGRYDVVATLYYDRRYRLLTRFVRAGKRWMLSATDRRFQLLAGRHHTDEYDRLLSGRADSERPGHLAPLQPVLAPTALPVQAGVTRIVLVPAGAKNLLRDDALRRWPIAHYVALARLLRLRGYEVVLAGGPGDRWASEHFAGLAAADVEGAAVGYTIAADAIATDTMVTDTIGKLSLLESLSLFDSAAVTITHDTGPLHLAGLTKSAIVAMFGPVDPAGRLPQRAGCVALWGGAGFACRPCYDGREFADCAHNGCLEEVTPQRVLEEVERVLTPEGRGEAARVVDVFGELSRNGNAFVTLQPTVAAEKA